jgi:uncharacterized membrane protein YphA (DoxX/SURF4 family)
VLFIVYGYEKIISPKDFAHSIMNYQMMPDAYANLFALALPWIEVSCGVLLVLGVRLRASALLTALMLVVFIVAIGVAMARGLEINCGCSAHSEPVGIPKILEDAGYLILTIVVYLYPSKFMTLESYLTKQSNTEITTA